MKLFRVIPVIFLLLRRSEVFGQDKVDGTKVDQTGGDGKTEVDPKLTDKSATGDRTKIVDTKDGGDGTAVDSTGGDGKTEVDPKLTDKSATGDRTKIVDTKDGGDGTAVDSTGGDGKTEVDPKLTDKSTTGDKTKIVDTKDDGDGTAVDSTGGDGKTEVDPKLTDKSATGDRTKIVDTKDGGDGTAVDSTGGDGKTEVDPKLTDKSTTGDKTKIVDTKDGGDGTAVDSTGGDGKTEVDPKLTDKSTTGDKTKIVDTKDDGDGTAVDSTGGDGKTEVDPKLTDKSTTGDKTKIVDTKDDGDGTAVDSTGGDGKTEVDPKLTDKSATGDRTKIIDTKDSGDGTAVDPTGGDGKTKLEPNRKDGSRITTPGTKDGDNGKPKIGGRDEGQIPKTSLQIIVPLSKDVDVLFNILKSYKESDHPMRLNIRDIALIEPSDFTELQGWECVKNKEAKTMMKGVLNCILRPIMERKDKPDLCQLKTLAVKIRFGAVTADVKFLWYFKSLPMPGVEKMLSFDVQENTGEKRVEVIKQYKELQMKNVDDLQKCDIPDDSDFPTLKQLIAMKYEACDQVVIGICSLKRKIKLIRESKEIIVDVCGGGRKLVMNSTDQLLFRPERSSTQGDVAHLRYMCKPKERTMSKDMPDLKRMIAEKIEKINPILHAEPTEIKFAIVNKNDKPYFSKETFFAPPIPYDLTHYKGVKISTLLDGRYKAYGDGESIRVKPTMKVLPLLKDADDKEFSKGGVVLLIQSKLDGIGSFKWSCSKGEEPVALKDIPKGQGLILNRDCLIKFNPTEKETLWKSGDVFLKISGWDGSDNSTVGSIVDLNLGNDAFSEKQAKLFFVREGCDGKISECKRKCQAADQEFVCGECIKGGTGKDEADVKSCGVCNSIKEALVKTESKCTQDDCGQKQIELCDQCVKTREEGMALLHCGQCMKTGEVKSDCIFPSVIQDHIVFRPINVCPAAATALDKISCKVESTTGASCLLFDKPKKTMNRGCKKPGALQEKLSSGSCRRYFLDADCEAGSYTVTCKVEGGKSFAKDISINVSELNFTLKSNKFKNGMKQAFEITSADIDTKKSYQCCYSPCNQRDKRLCCGNLREGKCDLEILAKEDNVKLFIKDCSNLKSAMVDLERSCDADAEPSVVSAKTVRAKVGVALEVVFDKPIMFRKDVCAKFKHFKKNVLRITEYELKGTKLAVPHKCFMNCRVDGEILVDINTECEQKDLVEIALRPCQNLMLRSELGMAMKQVNWTVTVGEPFAQDLQGPLNEALSTQNKRVLILRAAKYWSISDATYKFKACGNNEFGIKCCREFQVTIGEQLDLQCRLKVYDRNLKTIKPYLRKCGYHSNNSTQCKCEDVKGEIVWAIKNAADGSAIGSDSTSKALVMKKYVQEKPSKLKVKANMTFGGQSCSSEVDFDLPGQPPISVEITGGENLCVTCDAEKFILHAKASVRQKGETFKWQCLDNNDEENCFISSNAPDSSLKNMLINVTQMLSCGETYKFSVTYNGEHQSKPIEVTTASACSPRIRRCGKTRPTKNSDNYVITCNIEGVQKDDVTIVLNPEGDKEFATDLDDKDIITHVKELGQGRGVQLKASINKDVLTEMSWYQFIVAASNDAGESIKNVELEVLGAPSGCNFILSPATGITPDTEVELIISNCEAGGNVIQYRADLIQADGKPSKLAPAQEASEDGQAVLQLGKFFPSLNGALKIKAMALVKGFVTEKELMVTVENDGDIDKDKLMDDASRKAKELIESGDEEAALGTMLKGKNFLEEARKQEDGSSDDETNERFTESSMSDMTNMDDTPQKFDTVASVIVKTNPNEELSEITEEAVKEMFKKPDPQNESQEKRRRRKRRSAETIEIEEVELKDESWVNGFVSAQQSLLFPITYGNDSTDSKTNFLSQISFTKRTIAKSMGDNLVATYNTSDIVLYGQRLSDIISDVRMTLPMDSEVIFSKYAADNYGYWSCSDADDSCNGFYIVTSEINGDLMSESEMSDMKLVSNVFSLHLINPLSEGDFDVIDDQQLDVTVILPLNIPGAADNVFCHVWVNKEWSATGCTTMNMTSAVQCTCPGQINHHIAAFEHSELSALQIEEEIATITTPMPEATPTATAPPEPNTSDNNNNNEGTSTDSNMHSPTTGNENNNNNNNNNVQQPGGTGQPVPLVVRYSLDGNYNDILASYPTAQTSICEATRNKLGVTAEQFKDCTIFPGSVVVNFTLVMDDSNAMNEIIVNMNNQVENNEFKITLSINTVLEPKAGSMNVNDSPYKNVPPATKDDEDDGDTTIIIIAVVVTFIIIGVIVLVLILVIKSKNNAKNKVGGTDYSKMKDGSPRQDGIGNPTYDSSHA